jgi:hypothetical protein
VLEYAKYLFVEENYDRIVWEKQPNADAIRHWVKRKKEALKKLRIRGIKDEIDNILDVHGTIDSVHELFTTVQDHKEKIRDI